MSSPYLSVLRHYFNSNIFQEASHGAVFETADVPLVESNSVRRAHY